LYGKPTYFNSTSQQLNSSTYGVAVLGNGGARWIPQLGLYDDRNRFMSPDLGRFLQPDPVGVSARVHMVLESSFEVKSTDCPTTVLEVRLPGLASKATLSKICRGFFEHTD